MIISNHVKAEQSVLSTLLSYEDQYDVASEKISADDFESAAHQDIYKIISELFEQNKVCDPFTVMEVIESRFTGPDFDYLDKRLAEIGATFAAMPKSFLSHVELIRSNSLRRKSVKILEKGLLQLNNFADVHYTQSLLVSELSNIEGDSDSQQVFGFDDMAHRMISHIEMVRSGVTPYLDTGFDELDTLMQVKNGDLVIVAARPSIGKEQPYSAKVRTTSGWTTMGALNVGDEIASIDGKPSTVAAIFEQGVKQSYRVTFADGRSTEAGIDHLWEVMYRDWGKPRVVSTARLIEMLTRVRYKNRVWIEPYAIESDSKKELPIKPYLMGVILGDGGISQNTATITNSSDFIIDKCKSLLPDGDVFSPAKKGTWRIKTEKSSAVSPLVKQHLHSYELMGCLSTQKFIPRDYIDASIADRLELIRGLIDTDGYVGKCGTMQYNTSSKQLSDDFTELMRSVGGICKVTSKIPTYDYKGENLEGAKHYTHQIYHKDLSSLLTLPRKLERLHSRKSGRHMRLTLQSVEPTGMEQQRCISVSHDTSLYITDGYTVTHNSLITVNMQSHLAKFKEGVSVFFSIEMNELSVMQRVASSECSIPLQHIQNNQMTVDEWAKIQRFLTDKPTDRLKVVRDTNLNISAIRRNLVRLKREHGKISSIGVDYLQLMDGLSGDDSVKRIGDVTRSLKIMADEFDCPVFLLSQLNRAVEKRPNKRPTMSDLRDSGSIEQDADVIMFLYREDYYKKMAGETDFDGMADIIIGKNRDGETGTKRLAFEGHMGRFSNHMPYYNSVDEIPDYGN